MYAQLRYYMRIPNPEELPEEEVLMRWKELEFLRQKEAEHVNNETPNR